MGSVNNIDEICAGAITDLANDLVASGQRDAAGLLLKAAVEPLQKGLDERLFVEVGEAAKQVARERDIPFTFGRTQRGSESTNIYKVGECRVEHRRLGLQVSVLLTAPKDADPRERLLAKAIQAKLRKCYAEQGEQLLAKSEDLTKAISKKTGKPMLPKRGTWQRMHRQAQLAGKDPNDSGEHGDWDMGHEDRKEADRGDFHQALPLEWRHHQTGNVVRSSDAHHGDYTVEKLSGRSKKTPATFAVSYHNHSLDSWHNVGANGAHGPNTSPKRLLRAATARPRSFDFGQEHEHPSVEAAKDAAQTHHVAKHYGLKPHEVDAYHKAFPDRKVHQLAGAHPDHVRREVDRAVAAYPPEHIIKSELAKGDIIGLDQSKRKKPIEAPSKPAKVLLGPQEHLAAMQHHAKLQRHHAYHFLKELNEQGGHATGLHSALADEHEAAGMAHAKRIGRTKDDFEGMMAGELHQPENPIKEFTPHKHDHALGQPTNVVPMGKAEAFLHDLAKAMGRPKSKRKALGRKKVGRKRLSSKHIGSQIGPTALLHHDGSALGPTQIGR